MRTADLRHDTLRALRRTRQIREFTGEPVDDRLIDTILDEARWSGSAMNRQAWTFVVVRDRETLQRLGSIASQVKGVPSSAVTIAIGMDPGLNPEWDPFDEGRASERMLVTATAL